jgi:hypothetical protein
MRSSSISGRLRTASDLEESGLINRRQKGIIKDLIISGDDGFLHDALDKVEKGSTADLETFLISRRTSIDLLDGLDFNFLQGFQSGEDERDISHAFEEDDLLGIGSMDDFKAFSYSDPLLLDPAFGDYIRSRSSSRDMANEVDMSAYSAIAMSLQAKKNLDGPSYKMPKKGIDASVHLTIDPSSFGSMGNSSIDPNRKLPNPSDLSQVAVAKQGVDEAIRDAGQPVVVGRPGYIGAYSPQQRKLRIEKFFEKRNSRIWTKKVKYDVRKNFADSRLRVKGRFVKKEEEDATGAAAAAVAPTTIKKEGDSNKDVISAMSATANSKAKTENVNVSLNTSLQVGIPVTTPLSTVNPVPGTGMGSYGMTLGNTGLPYPATPLQFHLPNTPAPTPATFHNPPSASMPKAAGPV